MTALAGEGGEGRLITVSAVVFLLVMLFAAGYPMVEKFSAQGSSQDVVIASGAYMTQIVTTNPAGQLVTTAVWTSGTYTTTLGGTATTQYAVVTTTTGGVVVTTTAPPPANAWLTVTIEGVFKLLNPEGQPVESHTFSLAPLTGDGVADSLLLDAQYSVQGEGIDWSTLTVNCNAAGATDQPRAGDPNTQENVNTIPLLKQWFDQTPKSGALKLQSKIDWLLGGKTWDKNRKLTSSLAVVCTATAKKLPGYELAGGGDTVTATVGPVTALAHLKWVEPSAEPVTPTPAPSTGYVTPTTPPAAAPTTKPETVAPTWNRVFDRPECPEGYLLGPEPDECTLMSYSQQVATNTAGGVAPSYCFLSGTPIVSASGAEVPVQTVRVGDQLLSVQPGMMETTTATVIGVSVREVSGYYKIVLTDGSTVAVTGEHPVLTKEGFTPVRQLVVGTSVYRLDRGNLQLKETSIASVTHVNEPSQVYSLTVSEPHTYLANRIVVHNKGIASSGPAKGYGGKAVQLLGSMLPSLEIFGAETVLELHWSILVYIAVAVIGAFFLWRSRRKRKRDI